MLTASLVRQDDCLGGEYLVAVQVRQPQASSSSKPSTPPETVVGGRLLRFVNLTNVGVSFGMNIWHAFLPLSCTERFLARPVRIFVRYQARMVARRVHCPASDG
jgi:hypothetical protein